MYQCQLTTATVTFTHATDSNIHPPILYGLTSTWDGVTKFERAKMPTAIYKEMTDESAVALEKMDDEFVKLVEKLRELYPDNKHLQMDLRLRSCVLENYLDQVKDSSTLASTFRTNTAFAKHNIPYDVDADGKMCVPVIKHKVRAPQLQPPFVCEQAFALTLLCPLRFVPTLPHSSSRPTSPTAWCCSPTSATWSAWRRPSSTSSSSGTSACSARSS